MLMAFFKQRQDCAASVLEPSVRSLGQLRDRDPRYRFDHRRAIGTAARESKPGRLTRRLASVKLPLLPVMRDGTFRQNGSSDRRWDVSQFALPSESMEKEKKISVF